MELGLFEKITFLPPDPLAKQSPYGKKEPWTIMRVHTNGTIRIQCGTKSERIYIRRVAPFREEHQI
jgi:hypothetical protein